MMRSVLIAGAAALLLGACSSFQTPKPVAPIYSGSEEVQSVLAGNTAFAIDLYDQLRREDGNIFISPASISTAFGLAYAGAAGETREEIAEIMHFDLPSEQFHPAMGELLANLKIDRDEQVLAINNAIWVDRETVLEEDYLAGLAVHYGASDNRVDYRNDPDAARGTINRWVEAKTNDRIKDLLGAPNVQDDTRLILVNTIYLDADWQSPFAKETTEEDVFELTSNQEIMVPMMNQTTHFRHLKTSRFQAVELPYQSGDMSMVIVLPRQTEGLAAMEETLTQETLETWFGQLAASDRIEVELKLPKLELDNKFSLDSVLSQTMGMERAFSNSADFTGMVVATRQPDGFPVKLDKVIHQTFLKVDEAGTEAAAATAISGVIITGSPAIPPPPPVPFHADHPFLVFIKNNQTGAILFMGRIIDPR